MKRENFLDGPSIDVAHMLAAREDRVHRRIEAQTRLGQPTLTLSIVMPGPVKDCALSRQVAEEGRKTVTDLFHARGWGFEIIWSEDAETGPEALYSVDCEEGPLKRAMVVIEETHPLGRLLDLDIHDREGKSVSRKDFGMPARKCLVCGEAAHACSRSRAHSLDKLLTAMQQKLLEWRLGSL